MKPIPDLSHLPDDTRVATMQAGGLLGKWHLAQRFRTLGEVRRASIDDLMSIKGVGKVKARMWRKAVVGDVR